MGKQSVAVSKLCRAVMTVCYSVLFWCYITSKACPLSWHAEIDCSVFFSISFVLSLALVSAISEIVTLILFLVFEGLCKDNNLQCWAKKS